MAFTIIRNDITRVRADAVVNTANPKPVIGTGVDTAIHAAAGPELLLAREKIGYIEPGSAAATPAFGLPAKYVLHTVTVNWADGKHGEEDILRRAYDSALALADSLGCASVAFPLLAAGNYAFPAETALRVAVEAFTAFLMAHDMEIILALFGDEAFTLAGEVFGGLHSFIDSNYVAEKTKEEYPNGPGHLEGRGRPAGRGYPAPFLGKQDEDACALPTYTAIENAPKPKRTSTKKTKKEIRTEFAAAPVLSAQPMTDEALPDWMGREEETFTEALLGLLAKQDCKDSEIYRAALMSRQLFNKIVNDRDYQPKKSTALQLAVALRLDMEQTQALLAKAGYVMTRSSKSDLIVEYYIRHREYNLIMINMALFDAGCPQLGNTVQ